MKVLAIISLTGAMLTTVAYAQPANTWQQQFFKAKYGRTLTAESVARPATTATAAVRSETQFRVRPQRLSDATPIPWREQWMKAKYGRYSLLYEERLAEERSSADRVDSGISDGISPEAPTPMSSRRASNVWLEAWFKAKFGRPSPLTEQR